MARPDKVAAVADVKEGLTSSAATLLTNYRGLSVAELQELRRQLSEANASYRVAKNTLARIAARDAGFEGLAELLEGPTALVFCEDDPVGPAKAIKAFARDHPALEFKGGYLEGGVLDAEEALKLADLESREDLLTRLAQLMHGALANTARLLNALPEKQAQLLQALVDEGGGVERGSEPEAERGSEPSDGAPEDADEPTADAEPEEDASEPTADEEAANASDEDEAPATEAAPAEEPVAESQEAPESADEGGSTEEADTDHQS